MSKRIHTLLLLFILFSSCKSISSDLLDLPNGNSCFLIYTDVSVQNSTAIDNRIDFYDNDSKLFSVLPNKNITLFKNCSPGSISITNYRTVNLFKTSNIKSEKFNYAFKLEPNTITIFPFKIVVEYIEYASPNGYKLDTLTFEEYDKCIEYLSSKVNIDKWKIRKLKI